MVTCRCHAIGSGMSCQGESSKGDRCAQVGHTAESFLGNAARWGHQLERVSRTVQRRIPASLLVARILASCGFVSAGVYGCPSALLSGLLSETAPIGWP